MLKSVMPHEIRIDFATDLSGTKHIWDLLYYIKYEYIKNGGENSPRLFCKDSCKYYVLLYMYTDLFTLFSGGKGNIGTKLYCQV